MSSIGCSGDVEVVGGKVLDGVSDGETAQNVVVVRDLERLVHDVGARGQRLRRTPDARAGCWNSRARVGPTPVPR